MKNNIYILKQIFLTQKEDACLRYDYRPWYSSKTFLAVTVQLKVAVVKLLKHAPAMGQVEAAPGQVHPK